MNFIKRFALPIFGIIVGSVFFFPWNEVRDQITTTIQKMSGVQLQMQSFSPTLGLRMGLTKGSLLAFSGGKSSIRFQVYSVICEELIVGPRFWPFLLGQAQVAFSCTTAEGGTLNALTSVSPFWNPSTLNESISMENFSLENVDLQKNFQGVISGSLDLNSVSLTGEGGIPDVTWDLSAKNFRTPEANIPLLKLPGLDLGNMETTGTLNARAIKVSSLKFGGAQSILEGKLNFQSDIDESFVPGTGEIGGSLRVDPSAERGSLRDVPWKTFGNPDEKGQREFKRSFTGGIQNLFFSIPTP